MSKITYILGIIAGIGTWLALLADAEITQFVLAFACLIFFWLSESIRYKRKDAD